MKGDDFFVDHQAYPILTQTLIFIHVLWVVAGFRPAAHLCHNNDLRVSPDQGPGTAKTTNTGRAQMRPPFPPVEFPAVAPGRFEDDKIRYRKGAIQKWVMAKSGDLI